MRSRVAVGLTTALLILVAGCGAENANEPSLDRNGTGLVGENQSLTIVPVADRKATPEVSGPELGNDATLSTADHQGKVIVLNVWGSWCTPCRAEAADLQAASVATEKKAQFIGINSRDYAEDAAVAFVRSQKITYPSIYDPDGSQLVKLSGTLPLSTIPSTLIIDKQGRGAVRIVGPITKVTLVNLIDDVAAGK